jgi:hypothetical protein
MNLLQASAMVAEPGAYRMKFIKLFLPLLAACLLPRPAALGTNAVLYWNEQVLDATRLSRNPPPVAAVHLATFHAAIFDTVDGIVGQWQPWLVQEKAPAGADLDAAIAGAAFAVLNGVWGQETNPHNFQVAYDKALDAIPEGPAKTAGIAWGRHVAELVLAKRAEAEAGLKQPPGYPTSSQTPGKWRETPPGFRPPVTPAMGQVTPFVMNSPSQFRAPPPMPLASKEYADQLAYVAKVGPRDGAERTEYQTLSTPFWADDLGSSTPAGHWNMIAQDIAQRFKLPVPECARLFALLNFATADAGISSWETKFYYLKWRPETALREMDPQLNPHVTPNPGFIPNMSSPAHPTYTSAHSTFTGAASRLLALYFKSDDIEFSVGSDGLPGAVRTYKKFSDACLELSMSRVWGGIHTMNDVMEGQRAGGQIADYVFAHALAPVH